MVVSRDIVVVVAVLTAAGRKYQNAAMISAVNMAWVMMVVFIGANLIVKIC